MCTAQLPDGTSLPIDVTLHDGSYDWRVRGLLVTSEAIETYLAAELADLGVAQAAHCVPRVRAIVAGERLSCSLGGGGTAFVTVAADGSTAVELALGPAAAAVRSEVLTPEREQALERASRALADTGDDGNDDSDEPR